MNEEKENLEEEKPKKRKDVSNRINDNKTKVFTIVKCSLNQFINKSYVELLSYTLEEILFQVNKISKEAHIFANYHILRSIENYRKEGDIDIIPIPNQNFFYKCISLVCNGTKNNTSIEESFIQYKQLRPENYQKGNNTYLCSGILQNLSLQMATEFDNFIEMRFMTKLKNYLCHKYKIYKYEDFTETLNDLFNLQHNKKIQDLQNLFKKYASDIGEYKTKFTSKTVKNEKYWYNYNLIHNPRLALNFLYNILKYNERHQRDTEQLKKDKKADKTRLYTLLPTKRGFVTSNIKICSTGLCSLLMRMNERGNKKFRKKLADLKSKIIQDNINDVSLVTKLRKTPTLSQYWDVKIAHYYWKELFNIEKYETHNKKFQGEIVTDGKAVSITLFRRDINKPEKKKKKSKKFQEPKEEHIEKISIDKINKQPRKYIGLDPGYNQIYVASNLKGEIMSHSNKKYYHKAKFNKCNFLLRKFKTNKKIIDIETKLLRMKNFYTAKFEKSVKYLLSNLDFSLKFYQTKKIRNFRFTKYRYSEKELDKMCNNLTKKYDKDTVIGFGNFSNTGVIKTVVKGPVKKLERKLKRRCKVISVDEFRTSKLHHTCQCSLKNCYSKKINKQGENTTQKIHSVLHCKECRHTTMNRDVNASRNILEILIYLLTKGERHPAFSRSRKLETPFKSIPTFLSNFVSPSTLD